LKGALWRRVKTAGVLQTTGGAEQSQQGIFNDMGFLLKKRK